MSLLRKLLEQVYGPLSDDFINAQRGTPSHTPFGNTPAPSPPWSPPVRDELVAMARLRPVVLLTNQDPFAPSLSYYGGFPTAPAGFTWPQQQTSHGMSHLYFVAQWDCRVLSKQDPTGCLPKDGILYLFWDLDVFHQKGFRFFHIPGPTDDWVEIPPPAMFKTPKDHGFDYVDYVLARKDIDERDTLPFLHKMPFTPLAMDFPDDGDDANDPERSNAAPYWDDYAHDFNNQLSALYLRRKDALPERLRLEKGQRPFPTFPHDWMAVRITCCEILYNSRCAKDDSPELIAANERWRESITALYDKARERPLLDPVPQNLADQYWALFNSWTHKSATYQVQQSVETSVNYSIGFRSKAVPAIPHAWIINNRHRHVGLLRPTHMFGPFSYIQGDSANMVEADLVYDWILLLELKFDRDRCGPEGNTVQFFIPAADLRANRFDRMRMEQSCD